MNAVTKISTSFHSEDSYIIPVLESCIQNQGIAEFSQIYDYVEKTMELTRSDTMDYRSGPIRYKQIIRNLKSNKTLVRKNLAREIPGGFEITDRGRNYVNAMRYFSST